MWRETFGVAPYGHSLSAEVNERPQSQPNFHSAAGGDQPNMQSIPPLASSFYPSVEAPSLGSLEARAQSPAASFSSSNFGNLWAAPSTPVAKEDDAKSQTDKKLVRTSYSLSLSVNAPLQLG